MCFSKLSYCTSRFSNRWKSSSASVIFGSAERFSEVFATLETLRVIFESVGVNFGNFRNTSDDLRKPLGFSGFLRTNFENFRCNLHLCDRVTLIFFQFYQSSLHFVFLQIGSIGPLSESKLPKFDDIVNRL